MSRSDRFACHTSHICLPGTASFAKSVCLGLLLLPLFACSRNQELSTDVLQSFEIAFTRDDIDACLALFTDDAQILPEHGEIITTREGIKNYLQNQMTPVVSFNTMTDMSLVRGDIAIEQGRFKVRDTRLGSDIEWGKYIHIWKKVRGNWKLYRIIYNTDVAQPVSVSVEAQEAESSSSP